MGILVDMNTGAFVDAGDIGNLCEYVNALNEMEVEHNFRVFPEDVAYGEFA